MKKLAVIFCLMAIAIFFTQCDANADQGNHIDILKQSKPYCKDKRKFNIHAVGNPKRAAEIREYFQLDTLMTIWQRTPIGSLAGKPSISIRSHQKEKM